MLYLIGAGFPALTQLSGGYIMALTKEQIAQKDQELKEFIEKYKDTPGPLMPVMQKAQELYGYLSFETQNLIAESLGITVSDVYGVATFYAQFSLEPKGEHVISVCTGTACYVKGAQAVLEEVEKILGIKTGGTTADGKFTIMDTRCLGCCGLAPVMVIGEDVYGRLTPSDIKGILAKY
jgi:NADH:ubiquinone oxidoreductase subunit E